MVEQKFKQGDLVREKTNPGLKLLVKEYELNFMGVALKELMGANVDATPKPTLIVNCKYVDITTGKEKTKKKHQDKLEFWS
ncbi:hypothetical protein [Flavobacterium sp.]|uniref:hypothetical protein n=1 Tax=Flavobacterium sp. TaxID=239 RepID=UPI00374D8167